VVAVSPRGWKSSSDTATPHSRWITNHEIGQDKVDFEAIQIKGRSPTWKETLEDFNSQQIVIGTQSVHAGVADARLESDNRILIRTENIKRFSIWLHPSMVEFSKPIQTDPNRA